jgi:prevent-host-death family protein
MTRLPTIVPISDLRQDAAKILAKANNERGPLIITQRGRAAAVLLSVKEYEAVERQIQMLEMITRSEKEIASNECVSLETVLKDAHNLIDGLHES